MGKDVKKEIKGFYYKYIQKYMKFIPILGLIILFILYNGENVDSTKDSMPLKVKLISAWNDFKSSFNFSDKLEVTKTLVLIITLWTGYKYWLTKFKFIKRNEKLVERLLFVIMFLIFSKHIIIGSTLTKIVDWIIFLSLLYLTLAGSWFLVKLLDSIDLSSDLYCWGLRILGGITVFFGFLLFMSSAFALAFTNVHLLTNNIPWILSICIILIGAFMEYRSFRRHPSIHVW
jgi:hypothetical protein